MTQTARGLPERVLRNKAAYGNFYGDTKIWSLFDVGVRGKPKLAAG